MGSREDTLLDSRRAGDADIVEDADGRLSTFLLAGGHFVTDMCGGAMAPLLPFLIARLHLSLGLAGLLTSVGWATGSLLQPAYGYLADRRTRPLFVVLGPLVSALAISLVGLAPDYRTLLLVAFVGGMGSAAFHPEAASLVARVSRRRASVGMSLFFSGGPGGMALAPLLVVPLVSAFGLTITVTALIPGVLIAFGLYRVTSALAVQRRDAGRPSLRGALATQRLPLLVLWLVVVTRTTVISALVAFIPIALLQKGVPLLLGGAALTEFLIAGVIGTLAGGYMAERIGPERLTFGSLLLAVPALLGFLHTDGFLSGLFLFVSGVTLLSSEAQTTLIAQKMLPGNVGMASSLMMGLGLGAGALTLTPVGILADRIGMPAALGIVVWALPLSALLVVLLSNLPARLAPGPQPTPPAL